MVSFTPEERERLLALLLSDGILYASETQPVRSRDGKTARWMLDSLGFSLRPEGASLAGRALLALLEGFDGRQVATYGITAIPLLTACVMESAGRLNGLVVRKERKPYGSSKKIEGKIDLAEPTILIDDSIASGTNVLEGVAALEEAGLRVEGVICLVRFGFYGGFARLRERGYQVAAVFDIYGDVMDRMADEEPSVHNPTKKLPEIAWLEQDLPAGLTPPAAARRAIELRLAEGALPRPPERLDRDYDSAGGLWISLRQRDEIYSRPAREGFWHFPDDRDEPEAFRAFPAGAPRDLTLAAALVAAKLPPGEEGRRLLERCAIAVTFFSALEAVRPGGLDNDLYGIVVRSRERPGRMGGALPRMPGIGSAWKQFEHARRRNGGLLSFEPYDLFRHRLEKVVEEGVDWQKSGVPLPARPLPVEDPAVVAPVLGLARALVLARLGFAPEPEPQELSVPGLDTLFLSVYCGGRLRGCMGSKIGELAADLAQLATLAVADARFPDYRATTAGEVALTLSLLHQPLSLGVFSPAEVMERVRLGEQALLVYQGERLGLLLPTAVASLGLDAEAFALEVIDKAGITRPPYHWRRFECAGWLAGPGGDQRPLIGALPAGEVLGREELARLQLDFLLRLVREDGDAFYYYRPHGDRLTTGLDHARRAHLAWVLTRAARVLPGGEVEPLAARVRRSLLARVEEGGDGAWIRRSDSSEEPAIAEVAFLLLALAELETPDEQERDVAARLAATLWSRIGRHGRIATHRGRDSGDEPYQDYFPLQALLALAVATGRGFQAAPVEPLEKAFRYYRHRFRNRFHFGQVCWLGQAAAAWAVTGKDGAGDWPEAATLAFEVAELALEHQLGDGAFASPLQDGPGFSSALFLETLAAARQLAAERGDAGREERYARAIERGLAFLSRLTLQPAHAVLLPNPAWAAGGVRFSEFRDEVRSDFVQHALSVLLTELAAQPRTAAEAAEEVRA